MAEFPGLHITITDMRRAGYCVSGIRRWSAQHGIDFAALVRNGISADELVTKGDHHARRVVESVLERGDG